MFSAHTEKLRREVDGLLKVIATHEQIRSIFLGASPYTIFPAPFTEIKQHVPDHVVWRIYDHSAGYTRLYALFEHFVFDVVEEWLIVLPTLYALYSQLPEPVRNAHRMGVGQILQKLGGDQYQHLSEDTVLKGIAAGTVNKSEYSFLPDAFHTENQNLWPGVLESLFKKIGINGLWGWVNHHRGVLSFLRDMRGNASSTESELKNIVHYRNLAAHGDISEIVSVEEFRKVAAFILALSESLADLMMWNVIERRRANGLIEILGETIHNFSGTIVGVSAAGLAFSVDETIIVMRDNACHFATIKSIQENGVAFTSLITQSGQRIALELTRPAKKGSQLLRPLTTPRPAPLGDGNQVNLASSPAASP